MSSSDSSDSSTYEWKRNGEIVYVSLRLLSYIYHLIKDIIVNCHRSGATSQTYTVPNYDNSAAGSYTCTVTVSTVSSSESSSYSLTATGILIFTAYQTCSLSLC